MTARPPLFWIKQLSETLEEVKEIPLWGFPPPFPLDQSSSSIGAVLHMPELKLTVEDTRMRQAHETTAGLGANPLILAIELTPLAEPVYWVMGQEDVRKLCAAVLSLNHNSKGFSTPAFQEGFYRFLSLQAAEALDQLNAFGDLSIKMASHSFTAQESLCMDVAIHLPKQTLWGRIVCPHAFRHAFKEHFSMTPSLLWGSSLSKEVDLCLQVEVGRTSLLVSQWNTVKVGDFIILDFCSFDPSTLKGNATLVLNSKPLLRARLKAEGLKIIDYAFYHEEIMNENEHFSDEEEPPQQEGEASENDSHLWSSPNAEDSVESLITAQDIQLSLTVEVARLKINLERLLQLKPGNLLELPVRPEQGVDISIGGKKMAKAELVKLGDALGIKILHLGDSVSK